MGVLAHQATAAQVIAQGATDARLAVNAQGVALVSYELAGKQVQVAASGALNAVRIPNRRVSQAKFALRFDSSGRATTQSFVNACRRYDGPELFAAVATCKAPDDSYWALQSWQQALPDLGFTPWLPNQTAPTLYLSHWTGPLAVLAADQSWNWGSHYGQLFGTFTYNGAPVYGFGTTPTGAPTDAWGRLVYLDTFNSNYGAGWMRENSFVSRNPNGEFCYGFVPRDPRVGGYAYPSSWGIGQLRGPGVGTEYRLIASGPGVTPLVTWAGHALHAFDPNNPSDMLTLLRQSRDASNIARNACIGGAFAKLLGAQKWNSIAFPNSTALASLQDDFYAPSKRWRPPTVSGGATAAFGPNGLTFSLPAGAPSSASIVSVHSYIVTGGGALFADLGSGVPAAASFLISFEGPHDKYKYLGMRISHGHLEWVEHTQFSLTPSGDTTDNPPGEATEKVVADVPYDASRMRWLMVRLTSVPGTKGKRWVASTAASDSGPWQSVGSFAQPGWTDYGAPWHVRLAAEGDGTATAQVSVRGINE